MFKNSEKHLLVLVNAFSFSFTYYSYEEFVEKGGKLTKGIGGNT